MTYPQQPYGGQGQYGGQQYGGGQQPYGGYQQQQPSGQYGGFDPNAQYGGYPGGQYGGGYGGPPPQKKNTGPIIAIVTIVVLILGGLGVTGFVAPGFFLSDDKSDNASGGSGQASEKSDGGGDGGGADAFIEELVAAADGKDADALTEMACSDATTDVEQAINDIDEISGAELTNTEEVSEDEVKLDIDITVGGETGTFEAVVVKDGDAWCWQDITLGSSSGSGSASTDSSEEPTSGGGSSGGGGGGGGEPGPENGKAFVDDFLSALNSGDTETVTSVMCEGSDSETDVADAISSGANLQVDPAGVQADEEYVGADMTGTVDGAEVSAARLSAFYYEPNGWCVLTFYAF